ncbi:MAG TPA: hypothetical protein VJ747_01740 [Stellaceae bacterium]|nr:hypothetical protein [Stellaceae bacterium]
MRLLLLEGAEPRLQRRIVSAIFDGFDDPSDFAVYIGEPAPRCTLFRLGHLRDPAEFRVEFLDEGRHELGRHHALLEAGQHPLLNLLASDHERVGAGSFAAARRAAVAVSTDNCVGAAASATDQ